MCVILDAARRPSPLTQLANRSPHDVAAPLWPHASSHWDGECGDVTCLHDTCAGSNVGGTTRGIRLFSLRCAGSAWPTTTVSQLKIVTRCGAEQDDAILAI